MAEAYFIITSGEDGMDICQVTEEELLKQITPDEHGNYYHGGPPVFLDKVPDQDKGHFWDTPEEAMLIIRGEIVIPQPVKIVQRFALPAKRR